MLEVLILVSLVQNFSNISIGNSLVDIPTLDAAEEATICAHFKTLLKASGLKPTKDARFRLVSQGDGF